MAHRNPLLLLAVVVVGLCAGFAGFNYGSAPSHGSVAFAPAELRSVELSPETRPALTRGGFSMAAMESSRRKLRPSQRPPDQSLVLTSRSMADAPVQVESSVRAEPGLPLKSGRASRPYPARGPPV